MTFQYTLYYYVNRKKRIILVENHSPVFNDEGEAQKIEFFDGDVHLGFYDIRFNALDKKFLSISSDGVLKIRIHTQTNIKKAWLLLEDSEFRPIELKLYAETERFNYWRAHVDLRSKEAKFSFGAQTEENINVYFGTSGVANFISPAEKWSLDVDSFKRHTIPDWFFGGVMYQIFPEKFKNSNPKLNPENVFDWGSKPTRLGFQGGDLYGVIEELDYIKNLGVNIIYLNPIFLSGSVHKYDTWDHFKVDDNFGGDEALTLLIEKAHSMNMKVVLDCSLNHVHPRHFAFQDLIQNGADSKYKDWFTVFDYPIRLKYRPHLYSQTYKVGWDGNEEEYKEYLDKTFSETKVPVEIFEDDGPICEPTYKSWWGVPDMPKVNYSSTDARKWALEVTEYWIKNFDIDGWRMDVAKEIDTSFWRDFREVAKKAKKDILLLSEIFGDTSQWLQGDMFDGTMNYSFRENMIDFFANKNMTPDEFSESLAHLYSMYSFEAISSCQNLLSSHDVKRFLNRCEKPEEVYGAIFFQATFPGIASIYYGDEIGLDGGNEPNNREPFPWNDEPNWNIQLKEITSILMNLKNSNSILKYGTFELIPSSEGVVIFRRVLQKESLICIFNRDSLVKDFKISSQAHSVEKIYGEFDIKLENKEILINKLLPNTGIIIHEK